MPTNTTLPFIEILASYHPTTIQPMRLNDKIKPNY
jgi:hypothetical protein